MTTWCIARRQGVVGGHRKTGRGRTEKSSHASTLGDMEVWGTEKVQSSHASTLGDMEVWSWLPKLPVSRKIEKIPRVIAKFEIFVVIRIQVCILMRKGLDYINYHLRV
ncbi:hypothetical protein AVEN_200250-1 [Araneus ventricosus]|uniref:Uncharacterized protein n=1 Tax=Araneus ventricosus TaxID=182803 RepID=A0A4Y2DR36_ARAVE|nr:hypothetical protein AVEN_200250-1 [Araneus ventricosus]